MEETILKEEENKVSVKEIKENVFKEMKDKEDKYKELQNELMKIEKEMIYLQGQVSILNLIKED